MWELIKALVDRPEATRILVLTWTCVGIVGIPMLYNVGIEALDRFSRIERQLAVFDILKIQRDNDLAGIHKDLDKHDAALRDHDGRLIRLETLAHPR